MKHTVRFFALVAALYFGAANAQLASDTFTFDITVPNVAAIAAEAGSLPFNVNQSIPAFATAWTQTGIPDGLGDNAFRMRYAYNKTAVAGGQQFHGLASISGAMSFLDGGSTGTGLNAAEALNGTVFTFTSTGACTGDRTANSFSVGGVVVPASWYATVAAANVGSREVAVFQAGAASATLTAVQGQFIGSANVGTIGDDLNLVAAADPAPVAAAGVVNSIRGAVCGAAAGDGVTFNLAVTNVPAIVAAGTYQAQLVLTMAEKNTWTLVDVISGTSNGTPAP